MRTPVRRWWRGRTAARTRGTVATEYARALRALACLAVAAPALAGYDAIVEEDSLHPYIRAKSARTDAALSTEACTALYDALRTTTGDALVDLVRRADIDCISDLEWLSDGALLVTVSREANVVAVANGIVRVLPEYAGTYRSGMKTLFNFLRMIADIHYWCLVRRSCSGDEWDAAATYSMAPGSRPYAAVKTAIDAFVAHPLFLHRGEPHGDTVWEVAHSVIDYRMEEVYLHAIARWLEAWDERYAELSIFQDVMDAWLSVVYQGHRRKPEFGPVFGEDQELLHAFRDFVTDSRWLGTKSHWIMDRGAIELARYTIYTDTANYDRVAPILRSVLETYEHSDAGRSIWLRVIAEIDYNDARSCDRYDLCDWYAGDGFNANFRKALFAERMECRANACPADRITLHAQALGAEKLALACRRLADHSRRFQEIFDVDCTPVPDDDNRRLEAFVFNDGRSCEHLESAAFGRNPDSCSGIYWEGDPTDAFTAARFVATEYTPDEDPRDPDLAIWNFEHEYGHYLDGRYNRWGPYRGSDPTVHWWTEGFADYFAAEVSPYIGLPAFESPYSLTETLLRSGSIPTRYRHRHLAVRYFMQNRRDFVEVLLRHLRRGEFSAYRAYMREQAPGYEAEWQSWLSSRGAQQALNRVRRVVVEQAPGRLIASWEPVYGATGYAVEWTLVAGESRTQRREAVEGDGRHVLSHVDGGTLWSVRVRATRTGLEDGPRSEVVRGRSIPTIATLMETGETTLVELPALFDDAAGSWTFRVESVRPADRIAATVRGNVLEIGVTGAGDAGHVRLILTATDASGNAHRLEFFVAIEGTPRSWLRGWRRALLEELRSRSE